MAASPAPAASARPDEELARLFERYADDVLRVCRSRLRSSADAEDVAQQVFVRAYGALLRGERVRLPRHWLLRIAVNECRRHQERVRRVDLVEFDEAIDAPQEPEESRWTPGEIRRALDELVPAQRDALVLRELEGRSYAEIADRLRLSVSAVETLLFRARRSLREQLDGAIACGAAERALSLELDGRLPVPERSELRAHLRACPDCRQLARRTRARRGALRSLLPAPLQSALASLAGNGGAVVAGGAAVGTGVVLKAAALLAAGAASAGLAVRATAETAAVTEPASATRTARAVPVRAPRAEPGPAPTSIATARPRPGAAPGAPSTVGGAAAAPSSHPAATEPAAAPGGTTETSVLVAPVAAATDAVDDVTSALPTVSAPTLSTPTVPTAAVTVATTTVTVEPPPLPTVPELPTPTVPDLPG